MCETIAILTPRSTSRILAVLEEAFLILYFFIHCRTIQHYKSTYKKGISKGGKNTRTLTWITETFVQTQITKMHVHCFVNMMLQEKWHFRHAEQKNRKCLFRQSQYQNTPRTLRHEKYLINETKVQITATFVFFPGK